MFFSKGVLKNMCWSILLSWNWKLQQRYFPVNTVKFSRPASFIEHLRGLLLSVRWSNCLVLDIFRPTLLNQKHNVGWFLPQRFIDLVRASSSHISRNHSNTFSSNKHAENEYWSKAKHCSKGYFFWYQGFDDLDLMSILIYVNKKVATFIKKSLGNSSSWRLVQKKNRQKMYFYSNR